MYLCTCTWMSATNKYPDRVQQSANNHFDWEVPSKRIGSEVCGEAERSRLKRFWLTFHEMMEISWTRFVRAVYSACFDPPPVHNSVLRYDEGESSVFVTYRCNSGFAFESGSFQETIECFSETKTWDRYLGHCKRKPLL